MKITDPRFLYFRDFAHIHIKDDSIVDLVNECYQVIPEILKTYSKIKNPYPNVDAFGGALLQHYGTNALIYE